MLITTDNASDAGSLLDWFALQGFAARPVPAPEAMGAAETISLVMAGSATVRGALLVAREWITAHRKTIMVEVEGRGRFKVEGVDEIDSLIALLADSRPET